MSGYISFGSAAGVTADTWANRPISPSDGDAFQETSDGALYLYSSTYGEWVRPIVYNGTIALDEEADGTAAPGTIGWTEATSGSGTVSSNGTVITCAASAADADQAKFSYDHGTTSANHYVQARVQVTSSTTDHAARAVIWLGTGTTKPWAGYSLSFSEGAPYGRFYTAGTTAVGQSENTDYEGGEAFVELIWEAGDKVYVYVNHSAAPVSVVFESALSTTTNTSCFFGCVTGSGRSTTTWRDIRVGRF